MPLSVFSVTVPSTTVTADRTTGQAAFAVDVKNETTLAERVVLAVRGDAADGLPAAQDAWFGEHQQKPLPAGTSESFPVQAQVPKGQAAGSYGFVAVAYSADRDPAETAATGPRMTLVVPQAPPPPPKRWPWYLLAGVVAVLVAVGLFLLVRSILDDRVEVPEVAGEPVGVAQQLLLDWQLEVTALELDGSEPSPSTATGTRPPAGTKVEQDSGVVLRVTGITLPDLQTQTTAAAQQALEELGLVVEVRGEDSAQTPDTVLRTDPAAGEAVAPGAKITLVVATAPVVPVPDVRGSEIDWARTRLEALGLRVEVRGDCFLIIGRRVECVVMDQDPFSGELRVGDGVRLTKGTRVVDPRPFEPPIFRPPVIVLPGS